MCRVGSLDCEQANEIVQRHTSIDTSPVPPPVGVGVVCPGLGLRGPSNSAELVQIIKYTSQSSFSKRFVSLCFKSPCFFAFAA